MADYIKIYGELRRPLDGQYITDASQIKYGSGNIEDTLDSLSGTTYIDVPMLESDYIIQAGDEHKEIVYTINVGSSAHSIVGDSTIRWIGGEAPVVKENTTYIVSVIGSFAVWGEFPNQ